MNFYSSCSKIVGLLIHRTNERNPYCGLGACGVDHWILVMKINGSKVIEDHSNHRQRLSFQS